RGERDSWLLGDSGYGLLPWLITPVPNPQNVAEERFNTAHKACRSTVERCNGVLKSRFRSISRQRILIYDPVKAGKIVNACCTLHNVMILKGYPLPTEQEIEAEMDNNLPADEAPNDGIVEMDTVTIVQNGRRLRNQIIRENF
uniref:Uncharacterized protein n=1 Tax=Phlebotomus papatasi TaxID=29031 RepID=A0A1B0DIL0_PHLPP